MQRGWYAYTFLPVFSVFLICWNGLFRNSRDIILASISSLALENSESKRYKKGKEGLGYGYPKNAVQ